MTVGVGRGHLGVGVSVRFLHVELLSPPLPQVVWKEGAVCSPHFQSGRFCSPSLRVGYLPTFFEILLHGRFVSDNHSLIYSIICVYQWEPRNIFLLWIVIQCYLTYSVLRCLWAFFLFSLVLLGYTPSVPCSWALSYFIVLQEAPGLCWTVPAPSENQPFLWGSLPPFTGGGC